MTKKQLKEDIYIALQEYKSLCFEFIANQTSSNDLKKQENKILSLFKKSFKKNNI